MKIYAVGGAVRDELLGLAVTDRDYVVVGATPDEMVRLGYKPVGRDFPVFLHPKTHEEYALARTERKTARGYRGFEFHTAPDVTLEEDLARRDLTINAIARDDAGCIVDPYNGIGDLKARVLRHVGPAFVEDPVRILRVARFAARFGFSVAPETIKLMGDIVAQGEADALVAERVWQELSRGLMERLPLRMLDTLAECGALATVLPEIARCFSAASRSHVGTALNAAVERKFGLAQRFALLMMRSDKSGLAGLCERLRVPQDCRDLARLAEKNHADVGNAHALQPQALFGLLQATDALRRPDRFGQLLDVCAADTVGSAIEQYAQRIRLKTALAAAKTVDAGAVARLAGDSQHIKERIAEARVAAIGKALDDGHAPGTAEG